MKQSKTKTNQLSLFERLEAYLSQHHQKIFYFSMAVMAVFALGLFNLRISEGGDDSAYISRAMDLLASGRYPSYQGPLYPMFLSVVLAITGFNLTILKLTSLLFIIVGHWLTYLTFRNRTSYVLLFATLFLSAVNSWYLFFASQTYSEAMFILVQNGFIYLFLRFFDHRMEASPAKQIVALAWVALFVLLAFLSRTAGFGLAIAGVIYLLVYKHFRQALYLAALVVLLMAAWMGLRGALWSHIPNSGKQMHELMQKHPYDSSEGEEELLGFGQRFVDNSRLYLSKHFVKMAGFKKSDSKSHNGLVTLLLYALFLFTLYKAYRYNRPLFFVGLYIAVMLGITFISLQKLWDQYRLIIPYFPLMVLFLLYGLYQLLLQFKKGRYLSLLLMVMSFSMVSSTARSFDQVDTGVLVSNLKGNKYEGYTPDWENFLRMSEYVGKNLGADSYVACRKPDMARLYANGKKFYGIFRFDSEDADVLLAQLKEKGITHALLASLRKNPEVNNGEVINTLHRYMAFIAQKYPDVFELVHQIGSDEPAYLFRINYSKANPLLLNHPVNEE